MSLVISFQCQSNMSLRHRLTPRPTWFLPRPIVFNNINIWKFDHFLMICHRLTPRPTWFHPRPIAFSGFGFPSSRRSFTKLSPSWSKTVKSGPKSLKYQKWEKGTKILRTRYYEAGRSVVGDPDLGQILASLIGQLEFGCKYDRNGNIVQNDLHYKL